MAQADTMGRTVDMAPTEETPQCEGKTQDCPRALQSQDPVPGGACSNRTSRQTQEPLLLVKE